METAVDRVQRFAAFARKAVVITTASHDLADLGTREIKGYLYALAERVKGNSDWRGKQYDAIITSSGRTYTIALSRIKSIREL